MIKHFIKYKPVSFERVQIEDTFWAPRIKANRDHTIPVIYRHCKETGRIDALKLNWKPQNGPKPHVFWDSDVAKWLESASYSLTTHPDLQLSKLVDEVVDIIVSAQQSDGYINSYFTVVEPQKRWTDLRDSHELYCAGHLIEAAIAHYRATGSRKLLDAVCKYADYIDKVFGTKPGQKRGYPGHPEIELALIKLYRTTGNYKYLKLAYYFVKERGRRPNYFDQEQINRNGTPSYFEQYFQEPGRHYTHEYNQSHKPVLKQDRVVGHAVRAMYLYSAMTDLAIEWGDNSLLKTCQRLWNHLNEKLLYLTGGIGSSDRNEGFTSDYDLPNETAYCETCASIGLVFWNHRLLHADYSGQYADMMERALYNRVASSVSLDGRRFFYDSPMVSLGEYHRKDWFDVSCCPANVSRLLASLGEYIYSESQTDVMVHLYIQSKVKLHLGGQNVVFYQKTDYPWDGHISIKVDPEKKALFGINVRIPGWCRKAALYINSKNVPVKNNRGYVRLNREWKAGDTIELDLDMPVELVYVHPQIKYNRNRVAIQRGPIVYCLEETDNYKDLDALLLPQNAELESVCQSNLLGGVTTIKGSAQMLDISSFKSQLYQNSSVIKKPVKIKAIPYCTWDNRDPGEMIIWIRQA